MSIGGFCIAGELQNPILKARSKWRIYRGLAYYQDLGPTYRWFVRRYDGTGWWAVATSWKRAIELGWDRAKELGLCS